MLVRKVVKLAFVCTAASIANPAFSAEDSLVAALNGASVSTDPSQYQKYYRMSGCVLEQVTVNPNYCNATGESDGDRTIIKTVDLREVEEIGASQYKDKFHISFELDFGAPGMAFIVTDRILNESEGAFERFSEKRKAAFEAAELKSGSTYSNCNGSPPRFRKEMGMSFITNTEPKDWLRLVDLATECRATKRLGFEYE